nr:VanW family protein [Haloechinothrix aidingensis]
MPGQELTSIEGAAETVRTSWLDRDGVELEVEVEPAEVDAAAVQETLRSVAEPAVSGPVTFRGEGDDARLRPVDIGEVLTFTPGEDGSLEAEVDNEALEEALQPQLADTEDEARDAEIVFSGGKPTVEPSEEGRVVDWEPTLEPFMDVLVRTGDREIDVTYTDDEPEVTTEEAEALGIDEVIGEFTTEDFAKDSGINIRRVAQQVDGAIVKPGETFSLNQHTGPRTEAQGYVDAGIIENGVPGRAVGGGISQFATTLYNAAYFAGLRDAGHSPHSYYISRYPMAREATVFQAAGGGGIDLAFTNDAETGVAIQTNWTPSSITVRIWGTKRYDVDSVTSDRSDVVEPSERRIDDPDCEPSAGIAGFTATNTRILRDPDTGEVVRRESETVTYNPKPKIVCTDGEDD